MTTSIPNQQLTRPPIAKAEMLIRKPVSDVFEAFIDPAITAKFWFSKGSGKLEPGAHVRWDWDMYGVSEQVHVKAFDQHRRIFVEWGEGDAATTVEWLFTPRPDDTTFVSITNTGFRGDGDELAEQAIGSTEGFALVLAGLKALLEHDVILNLVPDRFPDGLEAH